MNDIGRVGFQPVGQLVQFLALRPLRALENGDRHLAQVFRTRLDRELRCPTQQPGPVQQAIEQPWGVAEQADLLLQEDVDTAIEHPVQADVFFVRTDRGVGWNQPDIVSQLDQRRRQRIVTQAVPADHATGSRGDVGDLHGRFSFNLRAETEPRPQGCVQSGSDRIAMAAPTR